MVDKKKLHESLGTFIDAVTNGEENDMDIFKGYVDGKVEDVLGEDSEFRLDGDDVIFAGKKIGTATSSGEANDKLKFESEDGEHDKEFDSLEGMYEFLADTYKLKEGMADVKPAVSKQDAKRGDRLARWSAVRGKVEKDGKEGDYDAHDVRKEHGDKEKGKSGDGSADDGMHDSRHKNGYYDSKDPRPEHSKSGAAHEGGEADLKTDIKYDKHDPRPHHKDPEKG